MALSAPKHLRQKKSLNGVSTVDGQDQSGYFQQVKIYKQRRPLLEFKKSPPLRFKNIRRYLAIFPPLTRYYSALLFPPIRNYSLMLDKFAKIFGEDSIRVRVFERALLKGNNVVVDMLDMLGLEPDKDFSWALGENNPSLDMASVKIMNMLDADDASYQWLGRSGKKFTVDRAQQASSPMQSQVSATLQLHYSESALGRKDIIDILFNLIVMDDKVEKYFLNEVECEGVKRFYAKSNREVVACIFRRT